MMRSLLLTFLLVAVGGCAAPLDAIDGEDTDDDGESEPTDTSEDALSLGANAINNGFFESAIYPWNDREPSHSIYGHWHYDNRFEYPMVTNPNVTIRRTASAAWGGTYGVQIKAAGPGSWANVSQYTPKKITGGAKYRIWVMTRRRSGSGEQCVSASFVDANGEVTGAPVEQLREDVRIVKARVGTSGSWHVFVKTFTAPNDAVYAAVGFGKCNPSNAASVYDWDSFSLRKVL